MKKIFIIFIILLIIYKCLPIDFFSNFFQTKLKLNYNDEEILPNIYYINLKERTDRNENILKQFKWYLKEKLIRVDAIKHNDGATGCGLSHIKALELALNDNSKLEYSMIVEDDLEFLYSHDEISKYLKNMIKSDVYWNVITLTCFCSPKYNNLCEVSTNFYYLNKVVECNTTTGYLIRKSYIPYLLKAFKDSINWRQKKNIYNDNLSGINKYSSTCIDQVWKKLQHNNWYSPKIKIATQLLGISDIEGKEINYNNSLFKNSLPLAIINKNLDNKDKLNSTLNFNQYIDINYENDNIKLNIDILNIAINIKKNYLCKLKEKYKKERFDTSYFIIINNDIELSDNFGYLINVLINKLKNFKNWNLISLSNKNIFKFSEYNNSFNLIDNIELNKNNFPSIYFVKVDYLDKLKDILEKSFDNNYKITDWYYFNYNLIDKKIINDSNLIYIVTTEYIKDSAIYLSLLLEKIGIKSEIIYELNNKNNNYDNLYILICMKYNGIYDINLIPKNYIFWQIEQIGNNDLKSLESNYFKIMNNSLQIYEIGTKNFTYYKNIVNKKIVNYQQLPFYNMKNNLEEKDIDLFFFGSYNEKRGKILNSIKNKLKGVKFIIKYGIFGDERDKFIKRSKFVLNIHFYDNPVLEIDRCNICINNNALIISEDIINDDHNKLRYNNFIDFFDVIDNDLSNLDTCVEKIKNYLTDENYNKKMKNFFLNKDKLEEDSLFYVHKNLKVLNNKIIDNYNIPEFVDFKIDTDIICLKLIETDFDNINRTSKFLNQNINIDYQVFPAIKHEIGWLGCGLSYKTIMYNAKRLNFDRITVFEDDCKFEENFNLYYQIICNFLDKFKNWDIFNGFIVQFKKEFKIHRVIEYKNLKFLVIDNMVSTVFNIYNKTVFDYISKWKYHRTISFENVNNHIDRYIGKNKFRIITLWPFKFNILRVKSTIDPHNIEKNDEDATYNWYIKELEKTNEIIKEKIKNIKIEIIE